MTYHQFHDDEGCAYGSYETFHNDGLDGEGPEPGWYWWACWPGCLPDSGEPHPYGPYASELEARQEADEYLPQEESP